MADDKKKTLYYLDELSDYKVASDYPDVRDWEVKDAQDRTVGEVDDLLVHKLAKRVVYLDVEVDEELIEEGHEPLDRSAGEGVHEFINKDGENHLIIPIGLAFVDEENKIVRCDSIDRSTFKKTRRFSKGNAVDREYELMVIQTYVPDGAGSTGMGNDDDSFYDRDEYRRRNKR